MRLFGTSGIRGIYLKDLKPDLFLELGLALATYLGNKGRVLIGGDCRVTTQLFKYSLAVGLMSGGVDTYDAGFIPLPVLAYGIVKHGFAAGAYVTASHNPPEYNGVKVFNSNGLELRSDEEVIIEEYIAKHNFKYVDWTLVGRYDVLAGLNDDYINELSRRLTPRRCAKRIKVLLDTANCVTSLTTPKILNNLGAHVVSINSDVDGRFPGREPEPRPDILERYIPVARALGVDVFLAHDGDGDRLAVIDPTLGFIKQDRIIALIFKYRLMEVGGGDVVISVDCGNAVKEVVEKFGGRVIVGRLGKIHEELIKYNAVLAAEPWKLIDPSWGLWIDSIYQASLIVKIMMEEGMSLRELMADIPDYPQARYSIRVPNELKLELYNYLREYLEVSAPKAANILRVDGLRVDYEDSSWILIRPSGTEAKVRIYSEGRNIKRVEEMINDVLRVSKEFLSSKGLKLVYDGALIP